jgi:hypothetical protein
MSKIGATLLAAIIGGFAAVAAIVFFFGWGMPGNGQTAYIDPTRADYVDLLLTVATIFLGAVGLVVTVGALVIGLVALKTLREIKDEAASEAKFAAAGKIDETMKNELDPKVKATVSDILPLALQTHLADDHHREEILTALARTGALDAAVERIIERINSGGPVMDPRDVAEGGDQDPN